MSNVLDRLVTISNEDYHADKSAIGSSTLKGYMMNPLKQHKERIGEYEPKYGEAITMGSIIHTLILEPNELEKEFYIAKEDEAKPMSKEKYEELMEMVSNNIEILPYPKECLTQSGALSTSKKAKVILEELCKDETRHYLTDKEIEAFSKATLVGNRTYITQEQYELAKEVADKARQYEFTFTTGDGEFTFNLDDTIKSGRVYIEKALYAYVNMTNFTFINEDEFSKLDDNEKQNYIKVKAKPDILISASEDNNIFIMIDLKSGLDATPNAMIKGAKLFYHLQEAFYTKIAEANGFNIWKFRFWFVGKEEWSESQDYEYDIVSKELGVNHLVRALKIHKASLENRVRESVFDEATGEFLKEPIVTIPNYLFYI